MPSSISYRLVEVQPQIISPLSRPVDSGWRKKKSERSDRRKEHREKVDRKTKIKYRSASRVPSRVALPPVVSKKRAPKEGRQKEINRKKADRKTRAGTPKQMLSRLVRCLVDSCRVFVVSCSGISCRMVMSIGKSLPVAASTSFMPTQPCAKTKQRENTRSKAHRQEPNRKSRCRKINPHSQSLVACASTVISFTAGDIRSVRDVVGDDNGNDDRPDGQSQNQRTTHHHPLLAGERARLLGVPAEEPVEVA